MPDDQGILVPKSKCALCGSEEPEQLVATCQRCTVLFCSSCASHISPQFCSACLTEVTVTDKTYTKTETEYNETTDSIIEMKRGCRKISFAGADWVFYSEAIHKMTYDELKAAFQFHRAVVSQMEIEMTSRVVKKHKASLIVNGEAYVPKSVTEVTKTRTTKPKEINLGKLAEAIKKLGLSPEQLADLLKTKE